MVSLSPTFRVDDVFWSKDIDFHIYEKAERAKGVSTGIGGNWNNVGAELEFKMRIAKARALDKAREQMIRAIHQKEQDVFPVSFGSAQPSQLTRFMDGKEGGAPSDIKL